MLILYHPGCRREERLLPLNFLEIRIALMPSIETEQNLIAEFYKKVDESYSYAPWFSLLNLNAFYQ